MKYLLAFGNPYLKEDNLALELADLLIKEKIKGIEIVKCISPEEVLDYLEKDFYILDVVKDCKQVMLIDDIDKLHSGKMVSLHDFDLGFFLKLMKETGKIEKVKILCIPQEGKMDALLTGVLKFLTERPSRL